MKYTYLIAFTLLLTSCIQRPIQPKVNEYLINRKVTNQYPLKSINKIHLIKINSQNKWFISSFAKIIKYNDLLYIFDNKSKTGKKIFAIDQSGEIRAILDKTGQGPGEYVSITDFDIDKNRELFYVVDQIKQSILIYNRNFEYVGKLNPVDKFPFNLISYNERSNHFVLGKGNSRFQPDFDYTILKMDYSGNIIGKYLPFDVVISEQFGGSMRMAEIGEYVDYLPSYSNSIYRIDGDSCYELVQFQFSDPVLTYFDFKATRSTENVIFNQSFIESESFLIFNWMFNSEAFFTLVNKENNRVVTYDNIKDTTCHCGTSLRFINFISKDEVVIEANNLNIRHIISLLDPNGSCIDNAETLNSISDPTDLNEQLLVVVKFNSHEN